ncbi:MAG: hypothetical protein WC260_02065 [Candidatus Pacearchaeota archaeon]
MIVEYPFDDSYYFKKRYFDNGVIFDTCVLMIFFLDKYVKLNPEKNFILEKANIKENQIQCLSTMLTNFRISKVIITPYILSEFINKIRKELKSEYKIIKKECLEDLKNFDEIQINKNDLLSHNKFIDYGNDISLFLATEKHIRQFKHSCIISFDGRFIRNVFNDEKKEVLAFDLSTLQYLV